MKYASIFKKIAYLAVFALIIWKSGLIDRLKTENVSIDQLKIELKEQKAILVDVREKDEVMEGIIEGALWIPLSKLQSNETNFSEIDSKLDRSKKIVVYCRSGNRSAKAASILTQNGYTVQNAGGYSALVNSGLPSVTPNAENLNQK
jgi:rhodanese-related sulfurtransferase